MDNIFQIGGQVYGESFIGRTDFVSSIKKNFIESDIRTSQSIVGLTRIGKSSAVKNCFLDLPSDVIYIYEDLNEWSTYNELWQDICLGIQEKLEELNIALDSIQNILNDLQSGNILWIHLSRGVKKIFRFISELNLKVILVLDEFDNASNLFNEGTKHFELFRSIFSDAKYNVSGITISRRHLHMIEGTTYQSSTFHGVFDLIPFKGFNDTDMGLYFDAFQKYGLKLSQQDKDAIIYYAGNSPYLLSIIGHYIIDCVNANIVFDIDKIFLDKCKAINDYYRDCIKHLERDNDLKRIIPFVIGPNVGVSQSDKDELFNLGYFRECNGELIVISKYFSEFISVNLINNNIWDNIITLEKKFKQLLEKELSKISVHFGTESDNKNDIFKNVLNNVPTINQSDILRYDSYIRNNKKNFDIDSNYLDVMSMNDVVKIIKECWIDIFSVYFNHDLYSDWEYKFSRCVRARNPVAHGHEEYLSELDKNEVDTYCQQIFDVLSKTVSSAGKNVNAINNTETSDSNIELTINNQSSGQNLSISCVGSSNINSQLVKVDVKHSTDVQSIQPDNKFIGKIADMQVMSKGGSKKNNLRGLVFGKYKAVITKNYLIGIDLNKQINTTVRVQLLRINNGMYEVQPLDNTFV